MVGAESDFERISAPYLKRILDDDGGRYFDIMNFHDYDYSNNAIEKQAKGYKELLKAYGYEKPLWITETGITSDIDGPEPWLQGSIEKQARWVIKGFVSGFACGAEKVFWHALYDSPALGSAGLISLNGKPKPSFYTYRVMTSKLDDFISVKTINTGQYKFEFSNKKPVYVLWTDSGSKAVDLSGYIKTNNVKLTRIIEREGQREPNIEFVSSHGVPIGDSPIFLEEH